MPNSIASCLTLSSRSVLEVRFRKVSVSEALQRSFDSREHKMSYKTTAQSAHEILLRTLCRRNDPASFLRCLLGRPISAD